MLSEPMQGEGGHFHGTTVLHELSERVEDEKGNHADGVTQHGVSGPKCHEESIHIRMGGSSSRGTCGTHKGAWSNK